MRRTQYSDTITDFLNREQNAIVGELTQSSFFAVEQTQVTAWCEQINIMKDILAPYCEQGRFILNMTFRALVGGLMW